MEITFHSFTVIVHMVSVLTLLVTAHILLMFPSLWLRLCLSQILPYLLPLVNSCNINFELFFSSDTFGISAYYC